jgi:hypothetical protein
MSFATTATTTWWYSASPSRRMAETFRERFGGESLAVKHKGD